jgi:4-carboxymuconolactone decarboxylase
MGARRFEPVEPSTLSADDRRVYDEIAGPRDGAVGGPFAVWMATPRLADAANRLGNALRVDSSLDRRTFELVTLVCAAFWDSPYPWRVHRTAGLAAGLDPAIIDAVGRGELPVFHREDEETAYEVTSAIFRDRAVDDELFERAVRVFGRPVVIELVTTIGFYSTASIVAKVFAVDLPPEGN